MTKTLKEKVITLAKSAICTYGCGDARCVALKEIARIVAASR